MVKGINWRLCPCRKRQTEEHGGSMTLLSLIRVNLWILCAVSFQQWMVFQTSACSMLMYNVPT
jgi:hypothetical protein